MHEIMLAPGFTYISIVQWKNKYPVSFNELQPNLINAFHESLVVKVWVAFCLSINTPQTDSFLLVIICVHVYIQGVVNPPSQLEIRIY